MQQPLYRMISPKVRIQKKGASPPLLKLSHKDSNLDKQNQNLLCYHYTMRQAQSFSGLLDRNPEMHRKGSVSIFSPQYPDRRTTALAYGRRETGLSNRHFPHQLIKREHCTVFSRMHCSDPYGCAIHADKGYWLYCPHS